MKKIEWIIVLLLIGTGLMCLTLSATTMLATESSDSYLKTFLQLCIWMGLPLVIVGFVYLVLLKKRKDK